MNAIARLLRVGVVVHAIVLLSGCASPLMRSAPEAELVASERWRLIRNIDAPPVAGVSGCGAQALAAVLAFDDPGADADVLAAELPWRDIGATPVDLLLEARRRGREATIHAGDWSMLETAVQEGRPLLVMFDVSPQVRTITRRIPTATVMHWGVVSGVKDDGSAVLVAAELARHHIVPREEFMRRWSTGGCCMIAVSDGEPEGRR